MIQMDPNDINNMECDKKYKTTQMIHYHAIHTQSYILWKMGQDAEMMQIINDETHIIHKMGRTIQNLANHQK